MLFFPIPLRSHILLIVLHCLCGLNLGSSQLRCRQTHSCVLIPSVEIGKNLLCISRNMSGKSISKRLVIGSGVSSCNGTSFFEIYRVWLNENENVGDWISSGNPQTTFQDSNFQALVKERGKFVLLMLRWQQSYFISCVI